MTAYINPFTDFGFKKLFGEEASKPLLKAFLNDLLPLDDKIIELDFTTPEQLPRSASERRAIYDLFCIDEKGHRFIVELQKNRQNYFKDRTVYYATFPIQKQAQAGLWDFQLTPVYCVGLLNFVFNEDRDIPDYFHTIKLKDQHCEIFYEKLTFFYIEFPKFIKTEAQLASHFDKFLYFIKHLDEFESMPEIFKGDIIEQGFERARLAQLNEIQRDAYEQSLKELRDAYNVVQTAREEGETRGRALERVNTELERQRADQEKQRADQEKQRAEQEEERAKRERQRAERAEQELEQAHQYAELVYKQAELTVRREKRAVIEQMLTTMTREQVARIMGMTIEAIEGLLAD